MFFFFQAEDGIRDLVRSRGLGDVYKRQGPERGYPSMGPRLAGTLAGRPGTAGRPGALAADPVSYTHLTLPTSDLV